MTYLLLNLLTIEIGGLIGVFFGRRIPQRLLQAMLLIASVCIGVIGLKGAITTQNTLLMLVSCVLGGLIGTAIGIDKGFHRFGDWLQARVGSTDSQFAKAFVTVALIQSVGAMSIVGPVQGALTGDYSILLFKAVLDGTSALIYGAIYGAGTLLAGPVVFLYQLAFFLLAGLVQPVLTPEVTLELSAIGNVLIAAISLDMLEIRKIAVADYLPAMLGPIIWMLIQRLLAAVGWVAG